MLTDVLVLQSFVTQLLIKVLFEYTAIYRTLYALGHNSAQLVFISWRRLLQNYIGQNVCFLVNFCCAAKRISNNTLLYLIKYGCSIWISIV